jgi:hypothetical protein
MPRHQVTPIRRAPGYLWAKAGCRLGTLGRVANKPTCSPERFCCRTMGPTVTCCGRVLRRARQHARVSDKKTCVSRALAMPLTSDRLIRLCSSTRLSFSGAVLFGRRSCPAERQELGPQISCRSHVQGESLLTTLPNSY